MTLAIRPFAAPDLPRVHAVCVAAFEPIHAGFAAVLGPDLFAAEYGDWRAGYAETLRALTAPDAAERVHVAEQAGTIVGFVVTRLVEPMGRIGEVGLSAVDPAYQRRGIGKAMVRFAIDDLAARGARFATVGTGGDAAHAPARATYAAVGFDWAIPAVHLYREL